MMIDLDKEVANGLRCAICGTYFVAEHGYAVACIPCYSSGESIHLAPAIYEEAKRERTGIFQLSAMVDSTLD